VPAYPGCPEKRPLNACLSFQIVSSTNARHTGTEAVKGRAQKICISRARQVNRAQDLCISDMLQFSVVHVRVFLKVSVLCKRSPSVSKTRFNVS